MKIAITGGAGYVGSRLVPFLLYQRNHKVTVLDTFWYGDHLPHHPNLRKIVGDIRYRKDLKEAFKDQDAVIHMACVSNDPSFDMNPLLGRQINHSSFQDIISAVQEQQVKKFIYASSSSVYGISDLKDVTEDSPKDPLTDYSKFKLQCEFELKSFGCGGSWTILRPATVCGYAPRQRLDLVVNILTIQALVNKKITIFGTTQKRPNICIEDMIRAYDFVLSADEKIVDQQIYNVGFENLNLLEIAELVKKTIGDPGIEIVEQSIQDPRSYHINSDRIKSAGFRPTYSIKAGITSLQEAFEKRLLYRPLENANYNNAKKMKELGL